MYPDNLQTSNLEVNKQIDMSSNTPPNLDQLAVEVHEFGEFTCFPRLPQELRLVIWEMSIPGPRRILLKAISSEQEQITPSTSLSNNYPAMAVTEPYQTPALLHTSRESRVVARSFFKIVFDSDHFKHPIYYNAARDVVQGNGMINIHKCLKHWPHRDLEQSISTIAMSFRKVGRMPNNQFHAGGPPRMILAIASFVVAALSVQFLAKEVIFVHQEWNEVFGTNHREALLAEFHSSKFSETFIHRFKYGGEWKVEDYPVVRHVKLSDFMNQFE